MRNGFAWLLLLGAWAHAGFQSFPAIQGKTVLKASHSPYVLKNHAVLGSLDTLIIEPGVQVFVQGYVRLLLRGTVVIQGTAKKPVRFRSLDSAESWVGIHFATGDRSFAVEHLVVEHAFRNTVLASRGYFVSSSFTNNYYGLWVDDSPQLLLSGCDFSRNRYALSVGEGSVQVQKSQIHGNIYGIYLENGSRLQGDKSQSQGNAESDFRDESAEITHQKGKVSKSLWRKVESRF